MIANTFFSVDRIDAPRMGRKSATNRDRDPLRLPFHRVFPAGPIALFHGVFAGFLPFWQSVGRAPSPNLPPEAAPQ
jgi:hypothetical protein